MRQQFCSNFVDDHVLPSIIFNGDCLINNNISIPKIVINIYIYIYIYIYIFLTY